MFKHKLITAVAAAALALGTLPAMAKPPVRKATAPAKKTVLATPAAKPSLHAKKLHVTTRRHTRHLKHTATAPRKLSHTAKKTTTKSTKATHLKSTAKKSSKSATSM